MTDYIFGLASAPEAEDDSLDPPQWSPQGIENLKRNKMFIPDNSSKVSPDWWWSSCTGGENRNFISEPVAVERGVGRLGVGGTGAIGFGGNRGLPRRGGSWAVTGNSERTGFSWSTETESILEPIWREKYLGEQEIA